MSAATSDALLTALVAALNDTTADARVDVERILPYTDAELADGPRLNAFSPGYQASHAGGGRARYGIRDTYHVQAVVTAATEAALRVARVALLAGIEAALFGPDATILASVDRVDAVTVRTEWGTSVDGALLVADTRIEFVAVYTDTYPATVAGTTLAGVDLDYDLVDEGEAVDITQIVEAE